MHFSDHQGAKLHYRVFGSGPKILFAFHGYGQHSGYFAPMEAALGKEFTIYAFDLFFHGKSVLSKPYTPLQKQHLNRIFENFLTENQINTFSLMGYSMGGKFVLSLLEVFSARIEQLYLVAPDGISTSFWYNVATYPGLLQRLFRYSVVRPDKFFALLEFMSRCKLIDRGLLKFAGWQMDSLPKRLQVYRSWMGFRRLTFNKQHIAELIRKNNIPLKIFVGQHDKVIHKPQLTAFASKLPTAEVIELNSGHTFLLQETARYLLATAKVNPV